MESKARENVYGILDFENIWNMARYIVFDAFATARSFVA